MTPGIEFDNGDTKSGKQGQFSNLMMRHEANTCHVCIIIELGYLVHISHNSMNSNPKFSTAR